MGNYPRFDRKGWMWGTTGGLTGKGGRRELLAV